MRGSFRGAFELFANGPTTMTSPKPANDEYRAEEHEITVPCPNGFVPHAQELSKSLAWALEQIPKIPCFEDHVSAIEYDNAKTVLKRSRPEPPTLEETLDVLREAWRANEFDGAWRAKAEDLLQRSGKAPL